MSKCAEEVNALDQKDGSVQRSVHTVAYRANRYMVAYHDIKDAYCPRLPSVSHRCASWETRSPTPLDDVYNRDALAGRACPQPLPSSLDVRRGRRHLPAVLRFGVCHPSAHPLILLQ